MSSAGVGPLFNQLQSKRSHLPRDSRGRHASICWQALWRGQFSIPAGPRTCPQCQATTNGFTNHDITVIDWPANSPAHLTWPIVKRKMRDTRPNNADKLRAAIKAAWPSVTPPQCHRLIASTPQRFDAVICAKGAQTKHRAPKQTFLSYKSISDWASKLGQYFKTLSRAKRHIETKYFTSS